VADKRGRNQNEVSVRPSNLRVGKKDNNTNRSLRIGGGGTEIERKMEVKPLQTIGFSTKNEGKEKK